MWIRLQACEPFRRSFEILYSDTLCGHGEDSRGIVDISWDEPRMESRGEELSVREGAKQFAAAAGCGTAEGVGQSGWVRILWVVIV